MELVKMRFMLVVMASVIMTLILSGCSGDDDPTNPKQEKGTVIINQTPDVLSGAGWSLTGPHAETGSGDTTLTDMPIGSHTLSWDAVSGYVMPTSAPQTLDADGTITFNGIYVQEEEKGTIIIDQTPNALTGAGWSLTGPQSETGFGDLTLTDMPTGTYTLTWNVVSGHITPLGNTQTLIAGGTIAFSGAYFVLIPSGTFTMGSPTDGTQHTVTLTTSFYMLTTEVTNQQYAELAQWALENNHCTATSSSLLDVLDSSTQELLDLDDSYCEISFIEGAFMVDSGKESHPVMEVSWYGAVAYCDWLSLREGLTRAYNHSTWQCNNHDPYSAQGYRLPTEAEWEYACRADTQTPFNTGNCLDAGTEANYDGNNPYSGCPTGPHAGGTIPVGSYPENLFGLYDMHGNLYEWCNDWYGTHDGNVTDPVGPIYGDDRVIRGGDRYSNAYNCRSAVRTGYMPESRYGVIGFRPLRSAN